MAKAGTEAELQLEVGAETDAAAAAAEKDSAAADTAGDAAAADIGAAAAGKAAAVPCRRQAAEVVPPQQPSGHLGGLCLVGKNMFSFKLLVLVLVLKYSTTHLSAYPAWSWLLVCRGR